MTNMVKKLLIIREILKGGHNVAAEAAARKLTRKQISVKKHKNKEIHHKSCHQNIISIDIFRKFHHILNTSFIDGGKSILCDVSAESKFQMFELGMGQYEKNLHWEVANAKPYQFPDSVFYYKRSTHERFLFMALQ